MINIRVNPMFRLQIEKTEHYRSHVEGTSDGLLCSIRFFALYK
ncbi:MAG: hypothetical protein WAM73_12940 [Desulfobacterales bacterium]